ncbi:hypothetical protein [Sphingobium sp. CFD-1]|uniref:hypothetical protein n=1 Tax=Sphingobium sp. CFD-1 TaxID=2878545 RepID=UPI00214AE536|nr:hypothetical protein [Sphingobium sp. CFD-1]
MDGIDQRAPSGTDVVDYDRRHLALYAALIDADDAGAPWAEAALLMRLDAADDDAEACWRSHLERARWIVGEGLAIAVVAFGREGSIS